MRIHALVVLSAALLFGRVDVTTGFVSSFSFAGVTTTKSSGIGSRLFASSEVQGAETGDDEDRKKASAVEKLAGVSVTSVRSNEQVEVSSFLQTAQEGSSNEEKTMLVFGTYAADFNAIEYVQRLRYYVPRLQKEMSVNKIGLILNCEKEAALQLVQMLDLPTDATSDDDTAVVELFVDPLGEAGRAFGCGRGWRPDDDSLSPYAKLFGMLLGLGAWATLPAVIGGYIGNPFYGQPWIEDALAVGQNKGRFPDTALEINSDAIVTSNKFKELPIVGSWERPPLELATLRLQNMVGISIQNWGDLVPNENGLKAGLLTQLGGLVVVDPRTPDQDAFSYKDPGICAVCNFEDIFTYSK